MSNIFTLENVQDFSEKISIDDLYEKKRQYDLNKLVLFNKILNRIHVKIKTISRQKMDEQFCWFVVPEMIIGVPRYDQGACIAYIIDKLKENGFNVRYIHPNTLFISWLHWVPSYVRTELKKKTGIVINEYGEKVSQEEDEGIEERMTVSLKATNQNQNKPKKEFDLKDTNEFMLKGLSNPNLNEDKKQLKKNYKPIQMYQPSGNLF
jgi:hypothetical protein